MPVIETIEEMYDLPLNKPKTVTSDVCVMRVPNGWVYIFLDSNEVVSSCFVPEQPIGKNFHLTVTEE